MRKGVETAAVIVAAGKSERMGFDKLLAVVNGKEVVRITVEKFDTHPGINHIVLVAGANEEQMRQLFERYIPAKPFTIVQGGATRAVSVAAGVNACQGASLVAIHDAARPFVSHNIITQALEAAAETDAAAPYVPVKDTIKYMQSGFVKGTPQRSSLAAVQTPQVFNRELFMQALAGIPLEAYATLTDDCMVMERAGYPVRLIPGEEANYKITTPADLAPHSPFKVFDTAGKEEHLMNNANSISLRIGHGYDVHRLAAQRRLVLGGVTIPYEKGLLGHSDADVLLHAVADALLGAAAMGDIGSHFPDNDDSYKGADSLHLLKQVSALLGREGYTTVNVDATILCQEPKLAPHIPQMRQNIAQALSVALPAVSVKATTEEKLGFTGSGEGIAAHCVALVSL